jgi:hypothetical protein
MHMYAVQPVTGSGVPAHDAAKAQERAPDACDKRTGSLQKIIRHSNDAIYILLTLCVGHLTQNVWERRRHKCGR